MKKIILIIISFLFISSISTKAADIELAARYLKLGNTYLHSDDYQNAYKYINSALKMVKGKSQYWEAVANEYLGYYYLNKGDKSKAITHLNEAQLLYQEIIKMDDGSQEALSGVLDMLQYLNKSKAECYVPPKEKNTNSNKVLNFDNQKLRVVPSEIPNNIENLSLADNKFREFPNALLAYKGLRFLDLTNNKIKTVPDNISELKNLKYLSLADNKLKDVPPGISDLTNLEFLNLKGNKIAFEDITNLIRSMPNTNILFDEYILKPQKGAEEEDFEDEEFEF